MCKERMRWKEKAKLMIDSMALLGSTAFYSDFNRIRKGGRDE